MSDDLAIGILAARGMLLRKLGEKKYEKAVAPWRAALGSHGDKALAAALGALKSMREQRKSPDEYMPVLAAVADLADSGRWA